MLNIYNVFVFFLFKAHKLSETERKEFLEPLLAKGWTLVNERDAIYKEFLFKDFNQVGSLSNSIEKLNHIN